MELQKRSQVPVEQTWDLSPLYANEEAFESALVQADQELTNLAKWQDQALESPQDVLHMLEYRDSTMKKFANLESYASLQFAEDASSTENQARYGRVQLFFNRVAEVLNALRAKLTRFSASELQTFQANEPRLQQYKAYLDEVVHSLSHRLSDDGEAVLTSLTSLQQLPTKIYQSATAADMKFAPVKNSEGEDVSITPFYVLMNVEVSTDTALRRRAYESLTEGLSAHQHTLAASLAGNIQRDVTVARMRNYPTVFDYLQNAATDSGLASNVVSKEHYFMVQDIMMKELAPHMRRYERLRKKVVGLDKSLLCDVKAPLESLQAEKVSFSKAQEIILQAAKPLGPEYSEILNRAFQERWIYRARNQGQMNGAFCNPTYSHPFVFAPFGEQLYDVLVLGHELGHAVHMDMTYSNQQPVNSRYATLFVETPSTLMEHFIVHYLRQTENDPGFLRRLTMLQLLTFHHNFVTHQLEAEILRRLYQTADAGKPLTTGVIRGVSRQTLADFWGDDVELDESADVYWMRQSHYYSGIYSYTYAVGLTGSTVMARRILEEGDTALEQWLKMMKSGSSKTPLELFAMAGIDMGSPEPYREAVTFVGGLIDELERSFQ